MDRSRERRLHRAHGSPHRRERKTLPSASAGGAPVIRRLMLLACFGAASLPAQLQLYWVQGAYEAPLSQQYGFGTCAVCNSVDVQFRLKNTGANPTPLTILSVDSPFSMVNAPQLPQSVRVNGAVYFTFRFAPPQPVS